MKKKRLIESIGVYVALVALTILYLGIVPLIHSIPTTMFFMMLFYVVFATIPILVCKLTTRTMGYLGFQKENLLKQVAIGLALYLGIALILIILPLLFGVDRSNVLSFKASNIGILIFYLVYDLIFVGFGEEIVFRGYFLNNFKKITDSNIFTIILSSILFGCWHYPNGQSIAQVIVTAVIGAIYATARIKIKDCSVISVSIAHGLHDATIILLSFYLL